MKGMSLKRLFKNAAIVGAALAATGCAHLEWEGTPQPDKERRYEPLLDPEPYAPITIEAEDASQAPLENFILKIDRLLHPWAIYTSEKLEYQSSSGAHMEAYLTIPTGEGPHPLIVMFPVLSGEQLASEFMAANMTRKGFAVLRMTGHSLNFTQTDDPEEPMHAYRHAILDARLMLDWVAARDDIDGDKIADMGVSMGSLLSGTLMGIDPRIKASVLVLTGGDLAEIIHDSKNSRVSRFRERFSAKENLTSREEFIAAVRPYSDPMDPLTYAGEVNPCRVLLIVGRFDKQVPFANAEKLWEAMGKPHMRIMPTHHALDSSLFSYWALRKTAKHLNEVLNDGACEAPEPEPEIAAKEPKAEKALEPA